MSYQEVILVVKDFEQALCDYTGAKYAVTTTSCTMALLLACRWHYIHTKDSWTDISQWAITIPSRTYISVPQSIIHAGFDVKFEDVEWEGMYQLKPLPVWDCARLFTSNMYNERVFTQHIDSEVVETPHGDMCRGIDVVCQKTVATEPHQFQCVSFHWSKTLAIGQGGAILHDNDEADEWFRKARFDGRTEGVEPKLDTFDMIGYHCYLSPRDAAEGLSRLAVLPKHNDPLPNDEYPDLSKMEIFK